MGFWGVPIRVDDAPSTPDDWDMSTVQTIRKMVALAGSASHSPKIAAIVIGLCKILPPNPTKTELARAIYWYVKNRVKFEEDEGILASELGYQANHLDKELLIHPEVLVSMPLPQGDCDDISMLAAALLIRCGIKCWFVTIAADKTVPGKWSHVYVRCMTEEGPKAMDCSHGSNFGWEYDGLVYRRMEWEVN